MRPCAAEVRRCPLASPGRAPIATNGHARGATCAARTPNGLVPIASPDARSPNAHRTRRSLSVPSPSSQGSRSDGRRAGEEWPRCARRVARARPLEPELRVRHPSKWRIAFRRREREERFWASGSSACPMLGHRPCQVLPREIPSPKGLERGNASQGGVSSWTEWLAKSVFDSTATKPYRSALPLLESLDAAEVRGANEGRRQRKRAPER